MYLLRRIWSDIRRGENIDLYITVVSALVLTVLNLLGFVSDVLLIPINAAMLGLIAIALLVNRSKLEWLVAKLEQQRSDVLLLGNYPPALEVDMQRANDLWLVGVSLNTTITRYYSVIERKLKDGCSIRALLINPDSLSTITGARKYGPVDIELDRARIRASLKMLAELQKVAPGQLQVRLIDHQLSFGAFGCELNTLSGVLYIEYYGFKTRRENIRRMVLRREDSAWFESFKIEIQNLWESALEPKP
jgi:hypothetical protein